MHTFLKIMQTIQKQKLFLLPILLFALLFILSIRKHEIIIFPGINSRMIEAFDDHEQKGNSVLEKFVNEKDSVSIRFTLQQALSYPFAGFKIDLRSDTSMRDFSSYDYFTMDLSMEKQQNVVVFLHTFISGFTQKDNFHTYRFLSHEFNCLYPVQQFTVPVSSFSTPPWWYYNNRIAENKIKKENFRQVAEIIIQNGGNDPVNQQFGFTLNKLSFRKNIRKRVMLTIAACLIWLLLYGCMFLFYRILSYRNNKKVIVTCEPIDIKNSADEYHDKIVAYIAKEYRNSSLTIDKIANDTAIASTRIAQVLKDKKHCSFKQYLNAVRIAEARRLLRETDRTVSEIAFKVGYNNSTHFNRIFREIEGVSPGQYRSQGQRP